ncbi:TIGR03747 family integrating conjugative element membrane protein [Erwinia psidii]|uniref:TIGR03747 family integrating conjugative element membrane protein n=1 Tax=Erwinia psidii TaxID=69224 RepID=UPI00226B56BA|nr:TIGR03747 family integrating conjugative element membrane protein [Erwinia psidii]MCX8967416.1 TIGR03747 family integrating conjugative element membrane protein [Erwinia psidii]
MSQAVNNQPQQAAQPRKHGLFYNLLWGWPWTLVGMFLASLLVSLVIEYVGMAFFWPELGASHSEAVMDTEMDYLSSEFTHSLLLSEPSVTVTHWITAAYQWAFIDSGFLTWIQRACDSQAHSQNAIARELNSWSGQLANSLRDYLLATVYVTVIAVVRVTILVLSIPLFILVILVALTEGLGRRDIRRYGAGYESSFVYHHAKRMVKPAIYIPCMLYLSWPTSVYPNLLLLPAAIFLGIAMTVTTASFKKYL